MGCYHSVFFYIYFFCRGSSKTTGKCVVCTRFFFDNNDPGAGIDRDVNVTYKGIFHLPIATLMDQAKTNYAILNLCYVLGDYKENKLLKTENFGEIFFEVGYNSLGLYVVYLQIYFRVYSNFLKPVTELITDKYLAESGCKKVTTKLKRINIMPFACYSDTGTKLLRYLNILLNNSVFEHIFFYLKTSY